MRVYELSHLFYQHRGEIVSSPKDLGLFYSYENASDAIRYYITQPGFCDNTDAFSIRAREVLGEIANDTVYEGSVYLHSSDYEYEFVAELGIFGDEISANRVVSEYCRDNQVLMHSPKLVVEKCVIKTSIEKREWLEGFSVE